MLGREATMQPMNLLYIMSDQHNPQITGCSGHPVIETPNLDALAASGTRFAQAYCSTPICVPSRASFATGRYAFQIGAWDNAAPYTGAEAPSWGHRLTTQGHQVTTIGKLHYRASTDPNGFPDERLPMHVLDGVGDLYGLLRGEMPVRRQSREHVFAARAGESEYIRYDRAVAQASVRWLHEEAGQYAQPWCLFVSFVTPHFPLVVPEEYFQRYPPESLPLPVQWQQANWPHHPVLDLYRRLQALDEPIPEAAVRNAIAAYYGLVTFMDEQVGAVLRALDESGLRETTRIIYTSDHGEQLGAHGLWWKSTMYDGCAAVPLIAAGPDVPAGKVVNTPVTLLDSFPTIVEAVGAELLLEDADLPGESLWVIARAADRDRTVFSEYHAIYSPNGFFMLRDARYKYVYYAGGSPPQLFNLVADPHEEHDLAGDPQYAGLLARYHEQLQAICDPDAVDRWAKANQQRRIDAGGGRAAVRAGGVKIPYTPAPAAFDPAPVAARGRGR
jgi:choline-sulfatase